MEICVITPSCQIAELERNDPYIRDTSEWANFLLMGGW